MQQSFLDSIRRSRPRWHAAVGCTFVVALAAELFGLHAFETTEYRLADVFMRHHAAEHRADPDIVVVDIDDPSMTAMQEIAGLWSWPREIHADLLTALNEFGPRAIVFDIAFSERDLKRPKSDARLSGAIAATPNVFLSAVRLLPALDPSGTPLRGVANAFGVAHKRSAGRGGGIAASACGESGCMAAGPGQ